MPAAKHTSKRFQIIDRCLTSRVKKYWSTEDLIRKLLEKDIRINARTLRYDIEAMRFDETLGYQAPIGYCKTNKGYHYTDPDYSINALNLTEEQLQSLDFVMSTLHEYKDLQVMKSFHGVIDKLAGIFSQLRHPEAGRNIEFEKAPFYKGLELRDEILAAIQQKQSLSIKYTAFGRSYPFKHVLHPYFLKEYKNRWYLLGLLNDKLKPTILALDRMDSVVPADIVYLENTYIDIDDYFSNFLGVTYTQGPIEEIVLEVTPSLANYIKTQHIHASQRIIHEDKKGLRIALRLIINYELIALLLSYGKDMRVLEPQHLKDAIQQNLRESLALYK